MSKLFKLKEWLTIPEAAQCLSIVFGENITVPDLLQLAMDEKLPLSVFFLSDVALRKLEKTPVSFSKATTNEPPNQDETEVMLIGSFDSEIFNGHSFKRTDEIIWTSGILNLALDSGDFDIRECKNFCVNGHFAGNCYYFSRRRNDCK